MGELNIARVKSVVNEAVEDRKLFAYQISDGPELFASYKDTLPYFRATTKYDHTTNTMFKPVSYVADYVMRSKMHRVDSCLPDYYDTIKKIEKMVEVGLLITDGHLQVRASRDISIPVINYWT